jgi:hypothetical protein
MVDAAKDVARNPRDNPSANRWRDSNDRLIDSVRGIGDAITGLPTPQSQRATPVRPSPFQDHTNKYIY